MLWAIQYILSLLFFLCSSQNLPCQSLRLWWTIRRKTDDASKFEGVDFGHVKYDHIKTRSVTIANTGRVPATVGFVDRAVESGKPGGVSPSWLKINFDRPPDNNNSNPGALEEHTLQPGDAVNVELALHVNDLELVRRLSDRTETLEEVLVLRIHNGRDYFLPLRGDWLQRALSCLAFAVLYEALVGRDDTPIDAICYIV